MMNEVHLNASESARLPEAVSAEQDSTWEGRSVADEPPLEDALSRHLFGKNGILPDTFKIFAEREPDSCYLRPSEQKGKFDLLHLQDPKRLRVKKITFSIEEGKILYQANQFNQLHPFISQVTQGKGKLLRPPTELSLEEIEAKAISGSLEFHEIPQTGIRRNFSIAKLEANQKQFTRYPRFMPYEEPRVKLQIPLNGSDFVNASPISFYGYEAIAFQAPTYSNQDRVWQMIFEQDIVTIVTLTNHWEERTGNMCIPFWSKKGVRSCRYDFRCIDEDGTKSEKEPMIRKRTLLLTDLSEGHVKRVTQFHLEDWLDKSLVDKTCVVNLSYLVHDHEQQNSGKTAVHCSASIGRTGVFMSVHMAMKAKAAQQHLPNAYQAILKLREQRPAMIATTEQFGLAAQAVELINDTILETKCVPQPHSSAVEKKTLAEILESLSQIHDLKQVLKEERSNQLTESLISEEGEWLVCKMPEDGGEGEYTLFYNPGDDQDHLKLKLKVEDNKVAFEPQKNNRDSGYQSVAEMMEAITS